MESSLPFPPPLLRSTSSVTHKPTSTQVMLQFQHTCISAVLTPIQCDNNNIFLLELCRSVVNQAIHHVLDFLPSLKSWAGSLRPAWFLPTPVIFKGIKAGWEDEFRHEITEYGQLSHRQGRPLPICFGIAAYHEVGSDVRTNGMLLTYCGTSLNERQELGEDRLQAMLEEALNLLVASGRVHTNLHLSNILYDGRDLWIIDLEQTSKDLNGFDIEAEALNIMQKYRFRQEQIRKFGDK